MGIFLMSWYCMGILIAIRMMYVKMSWDAENWQRGIGFTFGKLIFFFPPSSCLLLEFRRCCFLRLVRWKHMPKIFWILEHSGRKLFSLVHLEFGLWKRYNSSLDSWPKRQINAIKTTKESTRCRRQSLRGIEQLQKILNSLY